MPRGADAPADRACRDSAPRATRATASAAFPSPTDARRDAATDHASRHLRGPGSLARRGACATQARRFDATAATPRAHMNLAPFDDAWLTREHERLTGAGRASVPWSECTASSLDEVSRARVAALWRSRADAERSSVAIFSTWAIDLVGAGEGGTDARMVPPRRAPGQRRSARRGHGMAR